MEKWKKLAGCLSLAICMSACGGSVSSVSSVIDDDDDTVPEIIENLAIDDSVDYNYSSYVGTWKADNSYVLEVEIYDDDRAHFTLADENDDWIASGILQYVEDYGYVYAANDYDGIAYVSWFGDDNALNIYSFGTFMEDAGGSEYVNDYTPYIGIWYLDGDPDAKKTLEITNGSWIIWELQDDGEWIQTDAGNLQKTAEDEFDAFSERFGVLHYLYVIDENELLMDAYTYIRGEG